MTLHARSDLLKGIRVLDLSRVMSGPYCTSMLADLGAEVVKVELPGRGDDARFFGPHKDGESAYFLLLNRDKRSVTVDMKTSEGQALTRDLAGKSDVLVENFRPGVTRRLGLDYDAVRALNPGIVYASINGFGKASPLADTPALDLCVQAMTGLMSLTGPRDGPPHAVGESVADVATGMFAAFGIMAALFERERSGEGRFLEVAMFDSVFSMLLTSLARVLYMGGDPKRVGNRHPETYPVDLFSTRDGEIVMVVFNDRAFAELASIMGRPELVTDERFASYAARHHNDSALRAIIAEWTATRESAEVVAALSRASIPCAPVHTVAAAASSEHTRARGLIVEGRHAALGAVPLVPQPVRFSGAGTARPATAPRLGEHGRQVLREVLGLSDAAIDALAEKQVI